MINFNIGAGGDYSDIGLAWNALPAILNDDYTFNIISNFTEATGILGDVDKRTFNDKTLNIVNYGDYVITSNDKPYDIKCQTSILPNNSTVNIIGLKINLINNLSYPGGYAGAGLISVTGYNGGDIVEVNLKNLVLNGPNLNNDSGIMLYGLSQKDHIFNCKIYNFAYGIFTAYLVNVNGIDHFIENCSIYNCGYGIILRSGLTVNRYYTFRNVSVCDCVIKDYYNQNPGNPSIVNYKFYNCSDSDNSLSATTATLIDCITGIDSGDFESIDHNDDNFLEMKKTGSNDFIASNINPSIDSLININSSFESYSSSLYQVGTINISSWNIEDFKGNSRPDDEGKVSIGAYDKKSISSFFWDLDDGKTSIDENPTVSYNISGFKTIVLTMFYTNGETDIITKVDYIEVKGFILDFIADKTSGPIKLKTRFMAIFEPIP